MMGYFFNGRTPKMSGIKKLTLDDIQSKIEQADYLNAAGTLTICILTLSNGFTVTGESACLNPTDYDADIGKKIAYANAESKIWMLEGYLRMEMAKNAKAVVLPIVAVDPHDDMLAFIGTKIVNAKPMKRGDYNALRNWTLPTDENPADDGYLVEYTDAQRPNVEGYRGYLSWSPKDVFEAAYSEYKSTANQDNSQGEILAEGVQFKKPDDPTPLPFS